MTIDYYKILKVDKTSTEKDIKKAYKKLAMTWHPDKNPSPGAETRFKQICEAYDVLSDPVRRRAYDNYGEDTVFADVANAVEEKLTCTLEELWKGSTRKMRVSRTVLRHSDQPMIIEEVLKIDIQPGWKKGTKITFPGKGNEEKGKSPGDLTFVIDEKPHGVFKRNGNDLLVHKKISLLEALTGINKTLYLTTLDGRKLSVPITKNIINPGYEVELVNEGMPISKEPGKKGNLKVKYEVKFPKRLDEDQKLALKRVLGEETSVDVYPVRTRIEAYY